MKWKNKQHKHNKGKGEHITLHWLYGRLYEQSLGGGNAIGLRFRRDGILLGFIFLTETLYLYRALVTGHEEQ
jgi:hypothetical protein